MEQDKGAIYIRYSSAGQDKATLENQEEKCKAAMQRDDVLLYKVYADAAKSAAPGKASKRPAYNEMMQDAAKGAFNRLYIYNSNRLSREESIDALAMVNSLNRMGVKVVSASEEQLPSDLSESDYGDLLWLISAKENNRYITNLQSTVSDNLVRALKAGYWVNGTTPYGFNREKVYDARDEKQRIRLVVSDDEAVIVRRIFELYVSGESQKEIARILHKEGYKPRGFVRRNPDTGKKEQRQSAKWAQPRIAELLSNEIYSGIMSLTITKRKGEKVLETTPIQYEAPVIVPHELWTKAQMVKNANRLPAGKRAAQSDRPFSGLAVCAECGRKLVSNYMYKGRIALVCASHKYKHRAADETKYQCNNKQYIDEQSLLTTAKTMLKTAFMNPKRCRETYEKANRQRNDDNKSAVDKKSKLTLDMDKKRKALRGIIETLENNPDNQPKAYLGMVSRLENEISAMQAEIDTIDKQVLCMPDMPDE